MEAIQLVLVRSAKEDLLGVLDAISFTHRDARKGAVSRMGLKTAAIS